MKKTLKEKRLKELLKLAEMLNAIGITIILTVLLVLTGIKMSILFVGATVILLVALGVTVRLALEKKKRMKEKKKGCKK